MSTVALAIVYNHHYPQNRERLNAIYGHRFSHVVHLIPHYMGNADDVIPVFGNGHEFGSYVAQAYHHLKDLEADRFLFIGDDLMLNPGINQTNAAEFFGIDGEQCFLPFFLPLWDLDRYYGLAHDAYHWRPDLPGAEVERLLPSVADAEQRFARAGHPVRPLSYSAVHLPRVVTSRGPADHRIVHSGAKPKGLVARLYGSDTGRKLLRGAYSKVVLPLERQRKPVHLSYPIIGGYADIFMLPKGHLEEFCTYCGLFAAGGLFCEASIPTSLVLTTPDIVTEADLPRHGVAMGEIPIIGARHWHAGQRRDFPAEYGYDLDQFLADFPDDVLYFHPVKMSGWKAPDREGELR
jgi:hypothetical protein